MIRRISKDETQKLVLQGGIERLDLKLANHDSTIYYELPNGNILLDFKRDAGYSTLFASEDVYKKYMKEDNSAPAEYILKGFPATVEGFNALIRTSKEELASLFKLPLDYSLGSLKDLDAHIKKVPFSLYFKKLYLLLVAYVTKTLAEEQFGKIIFEYNAAENVLEPHLLLKDGRKINVFIDLFDEAQEDYKNFSVYATAQLRLHAI